MKVVVSCELCIQEIVNNERSHKWQLDLSEGSSVLFCSYVKNRKRTSSPHTPPRFDLEAKGDDDD